MSHFLHVCGLVVSVNTLPDPVLSSYYQQYYQCELKTVDPVQQQDSLDIKQIPAYFPAPRKLWPVFSFDQIHYETYQNMKNQGIKPGLIIPENFMKPSIYFQIKQEVSEGAIPILDLSSIEPKRFRGLATLATSAGLRPMAAYIQDGWNPNLKTLPAGLYIVQANPGQLPLPARLIQSGQQQFYTAYPQTAFNGTGIILNPQGPLAENEIAYPELGISWTFLNTRFDSQLNRVHTNPLGYVLLSAGIVILPLHLVLSTHYPNLLSFWGTSTSWASVVVIVILMLILLITMLWRRFKKS